MTCLGCVETMAWQMLAATPCGPHGHGVRRASGERLDRLGTAVRRDGHRVRRSQGRLVARAAGRLDVKAVRRSRDQTVIGQAAGQLVVFASAGHWKHQVGPGHFGTSALRAPGTPALRTGLRTETFYQSCGKSGSCALRSRCTLPCTAGTCCQALLDASNPLITANKHTQTNMGHH